MFAPRIKWGALEDRVEDIKKAAESYEAAFNDIIGDVKDNQNFQEVGPTATICSNFCKNNFAESCPNVTHAHCNSQKTFCNYKCYVKYSNRSLAPKHISVRFPGRF